MLGFEALLFLFLVGLAERINEPDGHVIVLSHLLLLLELLELLPFLLSLFLGELARVKNFDRHQEQLTDPFLFSCFFSCDSVFLSLNFFGNFFLKKFIGLSNEVRNLDIDKRSHDQLVFVLQIIDITVLMPCALGNKALWQLSGACVDLFDSELFHLLKLFCSADAAAQRESATFLVVQIL